MARLDFVFQHAEKRTEPLDEICFLNRLRAGYKLAVVTASARAEIEPLLAAGSLDSQAVRDIEQGLEAGR